jgi:hypothetical protein
MKKTLLTLTLAMVSVAALAQGRVNVLNDAASLVNLTTDTSKLLPADRAMAGLAVPNSAPLPSGIVLEAGLYGGTSSANLFLYSATTINFAGDPDGFVHAFHVVLNSQPNGAPAIPGIPLGTAFGANTPWFQMRIWNSAYATYDLALAANAPNSYVGENAVFQLNPQTSAIAYTGTTPAGPNSGWVDGNLSTGTIPEPSTFALAGLGAAALMIFRRRK